MISVVVELSSHGRRFRIRSFLLSLVFLLLVTSLAAAYTWDYIEFGSQESGIAYTGGSFELQENGFTLVADGGRIWGDAGRDSTGSVAYIKEPVSGDFTIECTIMEHYTDPPVVWNKAGPLVVQELSGKSRHVYICSTAGDHEEALNDKGAKLVWRVAEDNDACCTVRQPLGGNCESRSWKISGLD